MNSYTSKFILINKQVVPAKDLQQWSEWWDRPENYTVRREKITDDVEVSTVLLKVNASSIKAEPKFFETMVFGGEFDEFALRWGTWDEAVAGHQTVIEKLKQKK